MRIGIDARVLQNELRGQGQYAYYLIKNLLETGPEHEYVLFYNGLKKGQFAFPENTPRLKQVWCRFPGRFLARSWERLSFPPVECFLGNLDVFHNTMNYNFTHYSPVPARGKMVVTFHGMADPETLWAEYSVDKVRQWLQRVGRTAHKIIAVSELAKKDLLRRISLPYNRVTVVHLGVDDIFRRIPDEKQLEPVLSRFGLSGKRFLLYIGSAEANKNLSRLLDAYKTVLQEKSLGEHYLVLVGRIDANYQALLREAQKAGISERVIFTDYISHLYLPVLYNGAAAFVLPTLYEWFGMPVLEALACGVPVACSRNTGALEVVGERVVSFDPSQSQEIARSIRALLTDKDLTMQSRQNCSSITRDLSWKKTAEKTLAIYQQVS
ncbi:MAG: glycosyltransferase family 1 protein [Candidatus Omnitrophota bacterium]|jgi:glycosyltransferase involved in cell wall biosynthesis